MQQFKISPDLASTQHLSDIKSHSLSRYLVSTPICDWHSESIKQLANELRKNTKNEREVAISTFYWVRDNIKYTLGLNGNNASQTLLEGEGSCSHKANLVVALLRANGIPAAFRKYRVKSREYIGPINTYRFNWDFFCRSGGL